jgi:hypothetical protein
MTATVVYVGLPSAIVLWAVVGGIVLARVWRMRP